MIAFRGVRLIRLASGSLHLRQNCLGVFSRAALLPGSAVAVVVTATRKLSGIVAPLLQHLGSAFGKEHLNGQEFCLIEDTLRRNALLADLLSFGRLAPEEKSFGVFPFATDLE